MRDKIYVYIADDHQIIIDGIALMLKNEPGIYIIGSATNGQKAMDEILNLNPDVAIIDLKMPDKNGLQIIQSLKSKIPVKFILLSMHHDKRYIMDAKNYGADAYLFKNTGRIELLETIQRVLNNEKCFPLTEVDTDINNAIFLTPRELDVFKLIISEHSNQQVAEKLTLSVYTIETHRKSIMKKTGAKNLIGLVKYALDNNISFNE
ncbi:MAG: response regulator transcription factor [Bacteroidota bacterium]|nr:response regulator transcription factor [Bacteroidota bacterium]